MNETHKHCLALSLADSFDFPALGQHFLEVKRALQFKDALLVDHRGAISVVFAYGVVVHWNVDFDTRRKLHTELLKFAVTPNQAFLEDNFSYRTGSGQNSIRHDLIELQNDEAKTLLAVSHAMAQSIKLSVFEQQALETINTTRHLPASLASQGKINLSKKALAKIRGQLFLAQTDINLNYDLLDTPDFFWEHPEYQSLYAMAASYLELQPRTDVLSKKLETIHGLLEMLADEQKHQHSSTLEWIIIWLIMVEIIITLLEKFFSWP